MIELRMKDTSLVKLLVDNKSAINLAKHPIAHDQSKRIETRFHFIRDEVSKERLIGILLYRKSAS